MNTIFQIQKEDKRMCVYSKRDLDYMIFKGWKEVPKAEPDDLPVIPQSPHVEPAKRRGRPSKAH